MFNERLKQLRIDKNFTQQELAELTGLTKATISRFEGNKKTPSRESVTKLSKVLNVTTDYLLGLSEDPELNEEENKIVTEEGKNIMAIIESLPEEERKKAWEQLEMYVNYMQTKKSN
ncbi:transcriptional regulator [Bacillus sp. AFS098217]|uniref:helix-turn-helix domain-containing protein n=1 Tax=unclassified Bacillus (in: firmicutes) TaxID=185979 RepID=UPI000BEB8DF3|nr:MULTISPECIES: helix-turn-helix transcriptional regulator [unclassified Bacillus (in: firmicutes)]PEB52489.1 transcriptional regulator [Bacillus sp. AFS098217]PEU16793.1 transcriptional regulator [Bacillus sp. AFS019443]